MPRSSSSPPDTRARSTSCAGSSASKSRRVSARSGASARDRSCATCSPARRNPACGSSPAASRNAASTRNISPFRSRRSSWVLSEPLVGWRDLGDEILDELLVRQRLERHLALGKTRRAGIDGLAVDADHAFLAGVGVDAREADREAGIALVADPAQPVEHSLSLLEWNFELLVGGAAPDFQPSVQFPAVRR